MKSQLKKILSRNAIFLPDEKIEQFVHYLDLIKTWNRVFNLTAITNINDMIDLHLVDCLKVAPYVRGPHCLDVGSGAGFPGIPLAILNPENQWLLVDKNSKKTRFLTQVIAELALKQVKVMHIRSEDLAAPYRFDSILSRAFGSLKTMVTLTSHLLAVNGQYLAMKGKLPKEELADLPDDIQPEVIPMAIDGRNIERHLIILKRNSRG